MKIVARLERLIKKTGLKIFAPQGNHAKEIPLVELLAEMDAYDWDSVDDMPVDEGEKRERLRYLRGTISACGLDLNGTILDLASSITSIAYLYPDTVAVDNDPRKIKILRKNGIKAVIADIESLPFENKSFDYVVLISPPQKPIIFHNDGYISFCVDQEHNRRIIEAALRIARKNVFVVSYYIFLEPPYAHLIEKRGTTNGFYEDYYVLYRANNN